MIERNAKDAFLLDTLSRSPIGSLESRAAARALLQRRLYLVNQLVSPHRVSEGHMLESDPDFWVAKLQDGTVLRRGETETLREFEKRVSDALPAIGVVTASFYEHDETH